MGETEIHRVQLWLLEAVKQGGYELYESSINMLEAAVYHQGDAEGRLTDLADMDKREPSGPLI